MTSTLRDTLERAARFLQSSGADNARHDVREIAKFAFNMDAAQIIASEMDTPPGGDRMARFHQSLDRRAAREPLQHVLGFVEFYGLELFCDRRALIPRPDSERLVDVALEHIPVDAAVHMADLGTGSGCVLAALLSQRPDITGVGIEASASAAALAQANLLKTNLADRGKIIETPWEAWSGWRDADLIVSNPPYIATSVINALEPEVRDHDPMEALDGGADGLSAYRSIFAQKVQMKPGTILMVEIGYDQSESVPALAIAAGFEHVETTCDLAGQPRVVTLKCYREK